MLVLILAFIAGALTALAPCVLPLLPIIIGGSLSGSKKDKSRPIIIATSLVTSLFIFTILLKATSLLINVPPQTWIYISGSIVIALGIASLLPELFEKIIGRLGWQANSQQFLASGQRKKGLLGPILIGAALGPVFSSCSPTYAFILATVLPRNFISGLVYIIVYCLGLVIVLMLISIYGRRFIVRFKWASDTHSIFRRSLGILFIVVGVCIIFGWDIKAENWLNNHSPVNITKIDQRLIEQNNKASKKSKLVKQLPIDTSNPSLFNVVPTPAPEFTGISSWINSKPLTLVSLKGKVVLVDFWTYSCINCVRTLPYIEKWYELYKDKGFVVVGVEAPEFSFEKVPKNVQKAVIHDHLTYPIAIDSNLYTWSAYNNQYWPAHYLIDRDGIIRSDHFGEGDYATTEQAIQKLLGESSPLSASSDNPPANSSISPETYFGINRRQGYVGTSVQKNGLDIYTQANNLNVNEWDLSGSWQTYADRITSSQDGSTLRFHVQAKDVYVVVSTTDGQNKQIKVNADGTSSSWTTSDDPNGLLNLSNSSIYHLAAFSSVQDSTISLDIPSGVSLYTFTFGG